jgi:hypothetical protein
MTAIAARTPEFEASTAEPPRSLARRIDWTGLWFRIVEREGEFIGMRGGQRAEDGRIDWVFPSHAEYDGLGGFVHVLRQAHVGREFKVPARQSRMPSVGKRLSAVIQMCLRKPTPAAAWRGYAPNWTGYRTKAGNEFATQFFDAATTRRMEAKAHAQRVSLNGLLMHTLAVATEPELEAGPRIWMMPVNLRGPVELDRDTANQSGYLQLEISADATAGCVQEQIKLALRRRDHWASWTFLNLSQLIGLSGIGHVFKLQMARFQNRPFVGSFSNLGVWKGVGQWCVCPLVTRTSPVGVGAIVCNGRLALIVEAHASVKREAGWTQTVMDRWAALLQSAD